MVQSWKRVRYNGNMMGETRRDETLSLGIQDVVKSEQHNWTTDIKISTQCKGNRTSKTTTTTTYNQKNWMRAHEFSLVKSHYTHCWAYRPEKRDRDSQVVKVNNSFALNLERSDRQLFNGKLHCYACDKVRFTLGNQNTPDQTQEMSMKVSKKKLWFPWLIA